jgi:serine/threonine protein kinase
MIRNSDNMPILSDFGLAHVTQEQGGGGTLAYMAPELFTGGKVSVASDIYALGVTLYQLLSGQLPFQAQTQEKMIQEHLYAVPTPIRRFNPSLSEGIAYVIEKSLRKDPSRRYQTVTQLWEDFSKYAGDGFGQSPTLVSGLYGLRGEKAHHSINTAGIQITIGRSKNNNVCLHHRSVSRRHAAIFWKDDRYFVRDYGSTIGTFVNGQKIRPNEPTPLRNKDEIRFGIADVFEFRTRRSG